jgi:Fur family ferric uptake transcriptional regulator
MEPIFLYEVKSITMDNDELRRLGLKVTGPRSRILQMLEQAPTHHFRAEEVYKALRDSGFDVGLATVYRVLTQFEAAGLVKRQHFEEGYSVFELNQGEHHDHLVCIKCGHVDEFVDAMIEERQHAIAAKMGYQMTNHSLTIYGICKVCI